MERTSESDDCVDTECDENVWLYKFLIYLFIYLFIYSFIYLFIYSFIHFTNKMKFHKLKITKNPIQMKKTVHYIKLQFE